MSLPQQTPPLATAGTGVGPHPAWPHRQDPAASAVSAYLLIQTETGTAARVAHSAGRLDGVQHADEVAGPYDVIARIHAPDLDGLARLVIARIQAVGGVTRTLLCPLFHEAPHDLPQPSQI